MNISKIIITRILISFIGIIFLLNGIHEIFKIFSETLVHTFDLPFNIYKGASLIYAIIYLLLGYIFIITAIYHKNFFKKITTGIIGVSVFFFSLSFFLIVLDDNSQEFVDSVQPSIDILLASSLDTIIDENIDILSGQTIDIIISENSTTQTFNNHNLTIKQADFLTTQLNIIDLDNAKKIYISKLIITIVHKQIEKTKGLKSEIAIPLNEIKKQIEKTGIDLNIIKSIDENIVSTIYPIDDNTFLNLLISENDEVKKVTIAELTKKDVELIWDQLGLDKGISYETKDKILNIFLSIIKSEIEKSKTSELISSVPISTVKSMIPSEVNKILNFDILNKNITKRANEIDKLRTSCETAEINISEVCDVIKLTKYDYFMLEIDNLSKSADVEIPKMYVKQIETINSIDKLETQIQSVTKNKYQVLFLAILFLSLAVGSYYIHSKINRLELHIIEIIHKVNKINLINFLFSYIFLVFSIIIITGDLIFHLLISKVPKDYVKVIEIFQILPVFNHIKDILFNVITYSTIYLVILAIIFVILHFIIKQNYKSNVLDREI